MSLILNLFRSTIVLLIVSAALATPLVAQNEFELKAQRLIAAIQAGDNDAGNFYDVACYLALAGKREEAFRFLAEAIGRGYANVEHISTDSDLNSLHADARWSGILEKAAAKRKEQESLFYNQKEFWDNPMAAPDSLCTLLCQVVVVQSFVRNATGSQTALISSAGACSPIRLCDRRSQISALVATQYLKLR